ncbi:MAG: hypothetical protein H0X25_08415, partial [Acidobacteriales bacterium]|nr:hypothetical protein [Terriglobales bacterium]
MLFLLAAGACAQAVDPSLLQGLKWRLVGPFRGGRALTAVGVTGNPNLFYFGSVGGGVWKSDDAGNTWEPIFDSQPIASIGALAVAPSDPNVIYVGSGEADMRSAITAGNGMYKSVDAGRTWAHIGLEGTQQIGKIVVDSHDPNLVYVAALGHAYAANKERGVYRSSDGGANWSLVLHPDDNTGAIDLAINPQNNQEIFAAMWQSRRPPWNVYPPSNGPGSGLYKSEDGGAHWQRQQGSGLPNDGVGRMGVAFAPSDPSRGYLIADAKQGGLYRSDDGGRSWTRTSSEQRIWGRGWYFGAVTVDPHNPDVVYVANTSTYKSTDGGKTFTAFKGAPGGDDYHSIWISPEDSSRMILSSDQGATLTLNGGRTWSSWYNQPTAQLYHVATDTRFPYWIYGAQQDSGAIALPSRSNYSSITQQDARPIAVGGESDSIAPDPKDPDTVFGGRVSKFFWPTLEDRDISPTIGMEDTIRGTWTLPITFSAADPRKLYFSQQMLFETTDGGGSWRQISADLTRKDPGAPANLDAVTAKLGLAAAQKGVIYAIAPSPLDANLIWVGTDDGLIQLSHDDGKHWTDVTPGELTPWSKVGIIEASHFDKNTAFAAIDRHRLDDFRPYIYVTRDGGRSWRALAEGIPEGAFVNCVREDPKKRGLLYAGTELGVYVSFNDGLHWQPLQLNLPVASVRDIAVHENDLVVATHGRSFWVLDDISPLREMSASVPAQNAFLFTPAGAMRVRAGSDQGTPFPAEIAHGDNPPSGAVLYYYLRDSSPQPVTMDILDGSGRVVRRYSSDEPQPKVDEKTLSYPAYWVHPTEPLSATAGMHRFVWDLHYASPVVPSASSRRGVMGPWALPGKYQVRLSVAGNTLERPLEVTEDPRIKVSAAELQRQFDAARQCAGAIAQLDPAVKRGTALGDELGKLMSHPSLDPALKMATESFQRSLTSVVGAGGGGYGMPSTPPETDFRSMRYLLSHFAELLAAVESGDAAPTQEQIRALQVYQGKLTAALASWQRLNEQDLKRLN